MKKTTKGFTLIELMIVVAIIGILSAIAIPKFADLIRKSKEGATKGSLASIRSALTIYYGEQEGIYPSTSMASAEGDEITTQFAGALVPKYLSAIPMVKLGHPGVADTNLVYYDLGEQNKGGWGYRGPETGEMIVSSTRLDTKGVPISSW
ncbi:MAG: Fimbrial protein precursor [Elusimicrobia bacterium ADurb.Bin231]|nr:MAG: Fimbrial protein precursor [Elusimicrobia bacterium ADurb.Bin231]